MMHTNHSKSGSKVICLYQRELNKHGNNNSKKWNIINEIMNRTTDSKCSKLVMNNVVIENEGEIASSLNRNFSKACMDVLDNLPTSHSNHRSYLSGYYTDSFYLPPISVNELYKILCNLNNASGGYIGISTWVLKECAGVILEPLCMIYNKCISTGVFPRCLKIARLVPIFKSGDRLDANNYRPVSILSPLSKILEKYIS